MSMFSCPRVS